MRFSAGSDAMKLLVSCIPCDGGESGISTYAREVVRADMEKFVSLPSVFGTFSEGGSR